MLENSIYFENCISNHTWTLPSHNIVFSGLYTTQIKKIGGKLYDIIPKVPLLTELLEDEGYYTLCFTENPWINPFFNNTRGFKTYIKNFRRSFYIFENEKVKLLIERIFNFLAYNIVGKIKISLFHYYFELIENLVNKTVKFLLFNLFWKKWLLEYKNTLKMMDKLFISLKKKTKNNPYYLFLNIMATHYPYIPTKDILEKFDLKAKKLKNLKPLFLNPIKFFTERNFAQKKLSKTQLSSLNKLYNSTVFHSDLIIGRIIENLRKNNLLKDTYIIITSDHGEHLCLATDHYLYGHGVSHSAFEGLIKVPLIIYHEKLKKKIIRNQVQLKDLYHTIIDLSEINLDNAIYNRESSILYQIDNDLTPEYIFGEHLKRKKKLKNSVINHHKNLNHQLKKKVLYNLYFLRSQNYKYMNYENKVEELYNLNKDPFEQTNIIDKNPIIYKKMKGYFNEYLRKLNHPNKIIEKLTKNEMDLINRVLRKR